MAGSNLLARSCARNPLGFRTNETIAAGLDALAGPATQSRTHDAADRISGLTQSGPGATNVPSFDAAGNVTQLVVSARGQTFTTRYGYDFNSRLTAVTRLRNAPDGSSVTVSVTQLEYDGQGLLLRITENGSVRRLVRDWTDPLARPLMEMGATTNAVRWFVWANGKLLAQVASNGTISVAHSDELGKILALTDGAGALTDEFAYQPYGRLIAHSGTNDLPFAFMGDYGVWNVGNGLYLTRHRVYDANLMRFLQPDPIGLDGGYNLYAYASGNPLWFIDPLGLWYIDINVGGGYWLGGTAGVMINNTGIYPYLGGGVVTPGGGASLTWSPSTPTTEWNVGFQAQAGVAGQVGYGFGDNGGWFGEVGGGWAPGLSLTGYHVWGPFFAPEPASVPNNQSPQPIQPAEPNPCK